MSCFPHYCTQEFPKKDTGSWLTNIKNKLISEITFPGTHDSCCRNDLAPAQTQTYSLTSQFNDGIRFIDIRCRHINNLFAIHHDLVFCKIMFGEVLNECRAFLQKYPGECILMRVKEEYKPEKCTRSFQETFEDYYKANSDIISLISNVPYLDEIRGKIWIMRNFGYHEGYPWEASIIQDDYEINYLTEIKIKKEKIQNQLNNAINGYNHIIYINFCSGAGYLCWPFSTAKETNKVPMAFNGRLGIIVMDFPGEEAVGHLINLNY